MADSEHDNKFVEAIDNLINSATEQLKNKKQSDKNVILDYLQKRGNNINQQTLSKSLSIASLNKNGIIKRQKFLYN